MCYTAGERGDGEREGAKVTPLGIIGKIGKRQPQTVRHTSHTLRPIYHLRPNPRGSSSFSSSSVLLVLPRLVAAIKRLVSIKNRIFPFCKLIGLFLYLGFQLVHINVLGLLYDIFDKRSKIYLIVLILSLRDLCSFLQ